jgi:hypothetical protein
VFAPSHSSTRAQTQLDLQCHISPVFAPSYSCCATDIVLLAPQPSRRPSSTPHTDHQICIASHLRHKQPRNLCLRVIRAAQPTCVCALVQLLCHSTDIVLLAPQPSRRPSSALRTEHYIYTTLHDQANLSQACCSHLHMITAVTHLTCVCALVQLLCH